jgi:PAS domain S-box-containing protein
MNTSVSNPAAKISTRVLLAEGDKVSLTHIRDLQNRSGYEVIPTENGSRALELLAGYYPPELAVLSWTLPGLDGIEVCRRLRKFSNHLNNYLILLTPWSKQMERTTVLEGGADACLFKPVDVRELRLRLQIGTQTILERALRQSHSETELFLRCVPSILIGLDANGHITRWNLTAANTFGLEEIDAKGKQIGQCGIEWLHPEMEKEIQRWLSTAIEYRCDKLPYMHGEETRLLGLTVRSIPSDENQKAGFIVTGADVTHRLSLEAQLRQAQKLEAIGQLAAGIAHEINTPTQYVGDNTRFVKDAWESLASLLDQSRHLRRTAESGTIPQEELAKFDQLVEQADLEYLMKEIPHALDQATEGLQRVAKIVSGMKEFSHPGSEEKREIDLNKAIETTITVAKHEWKYCADVITKFDDNLPGVACLAGEFNQAILNLIINASHAIAGVSENGEKKKGTITISTRREADWVEISVADTGTGIPLEIQPRMFEPFFTTKDVGKGTGQGLALAHSVIVSRHQGKIWFETEMGKGTTFFMKLPIQATSALS